MFTFDLSYDSLTVQVWLSVGGCLDIFRIVKNLQVSRKVIFINLHFSYIYTYGQIILILNNLSCQIIQGLNNLTSHIQITN